MTTRAVLFDVDFTLIYPGPMFRGEGYQAFCARYGMDVDPSRFAQGVASAAPLLDSPDDVYDPEIFIAYTSRIIDVMGGAGPRLDECSREIYREWMALAPPRFGPGGLRRPEWFARAVRPSAAAYRKPRE